MDGFFLNIFVRNTQEVIAAKVDEKLSSGVKSLFKGAAKSIASATVADDKVTRQVASQLVVKVPEAIAEIGIKATCECKWVHKQYLVLRVGINSIDTAIMLEKTKGKEFSDNFLELMRCIDFFKVEDAKKTINDKINGKVQQAVMDKLIEMLPLRLKEQGIEIDCSPAKLELQADFFYSFMETL